MKTAILSIGTELLFGQIVNTNTVFLSQQLNMLGFDVMYHYTVGDNYGRVEDILRLALEDCDMVITTGGLGPTQDDLTKEVVCRVMNDKLVENVNEMNSLTEYFKAAGKVMTENNKKQAFLPSRAVVFHNENGTAPGFAAENEGKYVICMPGPPYEMKDMYEKKVKPFLQTLSEEVIYYRMARVFGIGESRLETEVLDLIDGQTDPTLATYAKEGECSLRVASKRKTLEEARGAVDEMLTRVKERVGEYIYSYDDEELVSVVCRKLMDRGLTLSSAESCTGGLFAAAVTDIPGISAVFQRGLVTYSNQAKMDELGVRKETLEKYGAVSEQTALEMVEGLKKVSGSDVCVAVTGIAGPGGGSAEKPVGLVYIGFIYGDKKLCRKINTGDDDRSWNRRYTLLSMLDIINRNI